MFFSHFIDYIGMGAKSSRENSLIKPKEEGNNFFEKLERKGTSEPIMSKEVICKRTSFLLYLIWCRLLF